LKPSFSQANILIVDDVNFNLVMLTDTIHNAGYIARPVSSARQAVNAIETLIPDLIVMDIAMPEIDGYVFCSMLKKSAVTRDIPVIFVSGLETPQDRIKGLKVGAVDFITKPFDPQELILRIDHHLKAYKIQQELELYNKKLNKIINEQIRKLFDEQKNTMNALIKLASKGHEHTSRIMELIGKNSRILALSLQLSPKFRDQITNSFIEAIELAAPLYDIGKVLSNHNMFLNSETQIPSNTDGTEIKEHVKFGTELLEEIHKLNESNEFIRMSLEIAKYHHENWDGSGYPIGLTGSNIPLSARIVAVVHMYTTLNRDRAMLMSCTRDERLKMINQGAGTFYDPDIVEVFHKIHNQLLI
jgi:putative two-component system response regulator